MPVKTVKLRLLTKLCVQFIFISQNLVHFCANSCYDALANVFAASFYQLSKVHVIDLTKNSYKK